MPQVAAAFATGFAFAATAVGSFLTTTFVGKLLTNVILTALKAALTKQDDAPVQGIRTKQTQTGGITPASFVLGRYASEGQMLCPMMSHGSAGGVPNAYLTYVIDLGDVPGQSLEGLIIDGEEVTIGTTPHADYGLPIEGRFSGHAWVKFYDGSQTVADPMLLDKYGSYPERPWTADMIGNGIAYAILTFRFNREIYSSFPKVRFVLQGIPLYDPRKDSTVGGSGSHRWADRSTWEQTDNPAVMIYNIKHGIDLGGGNIWGGEVAGADLPLANWFAAMNICDVPIALDAGGTEPQWRAGYEVYVNDEPAKVVEELKKGCNAEMAEVGGVWKIRIGGPGLPVYLFTDADVIINESQELNAFPGPTETYNGIHASHPDPASLWEPKDAPARYNAAYEAADGNQRRLADLTLSAVPYPLQVQRVMEAYIREERRFARHVLTLPSDAIPLEPLDAVAWTSAHNNYTAKVFEIASMVDPLMTGKPRLSLRERDSADSAWVPADEMPVPPVPIGHVPPAPQGVDGFGVTAFALLDANGENARPALQVVWDAEQDDVRGVMFEVLYPNGATAIAASTQNVAAGEHIIADGVLPGQSYNVRARFVVDRPTVWTVAVPVITLDLKVRAGDLDPVSFQTAGLSVFGGDLKSSDFVAGSTGWRIAKTGDAEFNSLVSREWLQVGSVSDYGMYSEPDPQYVAAGTHILFTLSTGPRLRQDIWHVQASFDKRQIVTTGSDFSDNRLELQRRVKNSGTWTPFSIIRHFPHSGTPWTEFYYLEHEPGDYDDVEYRLVVISEDTGSPVPADNFRNIYFKAEAQVV